MMTEQDRNARVVIEADTTKYSKGVKTATEDTNKLVKALGALNDKLDGIVKRSGKKLVLFGAADLAALTAASTVAATLQKQMSGIEATAKTIGPSLDADKIRQDVRALSREFPIARGEIAQLESAITRMGLTTTRQVTGMTRNFIELSGATGESAAVLGQLQTEFSRQMGTLGSPRTMSSMDDSLTTLSAKSGVSASSIVGFAQNLAPAARMAGISQQDVMGISTVANRAGADGTYAANVFSSIINDITQMKQTGSPDIKRYAQAIGVGNDQISNMQPLEIIDRLLKQVSSSGKSGVTTLSNLGFEGLRTQKALQAVAGQGGFSEWTKISRDAFGSGSTKTASEEAYSGFFDSMIQLKNNVTDVAQVFGELLLPPLSKLAEVATTLLKVFQPIIEIATRLASIATSGLGMAAIAGGTALRMYAGAGTPALIKRAVSSTPVQSMYHGFTQGRYEAAGGSYENAVTRGMNGPMGGGPYQYGRANRWLFGRAGSLGSLAPMPLPGAPDTGTIFRRPFNAAAERVGNFVRGNWMIGGATDFYDKSTLPSGGERIGPMEGRPRGFFRSFGNAAVHGAGREIFGGVPSEKALPAYAPPMSIAQGQAGLSLQDKIKLKVNEMLSYIRGGIDKTVVALNKFTGALNSAATAAAKRSLGIGDNYRADPNGPLAAQRAAVGKAAANEMGLGPTLSPDPNGPLAAIKAREAAEAEASAASVAAKKKEAEAAATLSRQVRAETSAFKFLGMQVKETTAALAGLGRAGFTAARGQIGGAAGGMLHSAGKGLGSIVGMLGLSNPYVAAAAVAGLGAYSAYSGTQQEDQAKQGFRDSLMDSSNMLRVYNDSLGKATEALLGFSSTVTLKTPTHVTEAMENGQAKTIANASSSNYTDARWKYMTEDTAKTYLSSLQPMDPEAATQIAADIYRRFDDNTAESMISDYLNSINQKTGRAAPSSDYSAYKGLTNANGINSRFDIEGVGWTNNTLASGVLNSTALGNDYFAAAQGENSPIAKLSQQAIAQYRSNVDYAINWKQSKEDPADKERFAASVAATEKTKLGASALQGVRAYDKESQAFAEQVVAGLATEMGLDKDKTQEVLDALDIRKNTYSEWRPEDLQALVWNTLTNKSQEGKQFFSYGSASEYAGNATDRKYSMTTEQTVNTMQDLGKKFGDFGKAYAKNDAIQESLNTSGNPALIAKSIEELKRTAMKQADGDTNKATMLLAALKNNSSGDMVAQIQAASDSLQGKQDLLMGPTNKSVQLREQLGKTRTLAEGLTGDSQESIDALKNQISANEATIVQMGQQVRDYHRQMAREEKDFQRQRKYTVEDYNRQVRQSNKDFERQERYSKQDFYRSLARQDKEYYLSLERSAVDAAASVMDPFSRVNAQATSSPESMIANLAEQNKFMAEQRQDLDKLKKMGLSQDAIDIMGLTDPNKGQQVDRFADTATKEQIAKINSQMKGRVADTKALIQSDDNKQFREMEQDRKRHIKQSIQDFERGADRSAEAFIRSLRRADRAQERSLKRQDEERAKMLRRAEKDLYGWLKDTRKSVGDWAKYIGDHIKGPLGDSISATIDKLVKMDRISRRAIRNLEKVNARDGYTKGDYNGSESTKTNTYPKRWGTTKGDYNGDTNASSGVTNGPDMNPGIEVPHRAVGGVVTAETIAILGERGKEVILPLDSSGMRYLAGAMSMYMRSAGPTKADYMRNDPEHYRHGVYGFYDQRAGKWRAYPKNMEHMPMIQNGSRDQHVRGKNMSYGEAQSAMNVYNNTTNFSGITVVTQDPDDMARKLKHKARMGALRGFKTNV